MNVELQQGRTRVECGRLSPLFIVPTPGPKVPEGKGTGILMFSGQWSQG